MIDDIAKLGTIMGIWAHPDDESLNVGGILSMAADNGQVVICTTATKGEAGVQDESKWPAAQLGEIRAKELARALEILGVQHHHWLNYHDGKCADVPEDEAVPRIVELIEKYKPDTIITFPPDGLTGHPDHQTVSRWARIAAAKCSSPPRVYFTVDTQEAYDAYMRDVDEQFNVYFATDSPIFVPISECDLHLELPTAIVGRKVRVLEAMPSQYSAWVEKLGEQRLQQILATESLVSAENDSRWAGL